MEFYNFNSGVKINDSLINEWIQATIDQLYAGDCHYSICCGDSSVFAVVYDDWATIQVANLSGISTINFKISDPRPNVNYTRPTK